MEKKAILTASIVIIVSITFSSSAHYRIATIGTGYVGLVSGTCFAQMGHKVVCVDIDKEKITKLKNGVVPIFEPELKELIQKNVYEKRLTFSTKVASAIKDAEIIIIAVNTPSKTDGKADLSAVESVVHTITENINGYKLIIIKSTVPIGASSQIEDCILSRNISPEDFDLVSNPEFLREGSAVGDFLNPDRIVIGATSRKAKNIMKELYRALSPKKPIVFTDRITAEAIKYASNSFLALKITFMNELANLCDATGASVSEIAHAMGLDARISPYFLNAGPGFGGSCFPKDSLGLANMAREYNFPMLTVQALIKANEIQKGIPVIKLKQLLEDCLEGKTIAVLGLAFKANTDDIRFSPAITTIATLIKEGVHIRAYDPEAMNNMKKVFPQIYYSKNSYDAVENADAAIVLTEWKEFEQLDLAKIALLMAKKIIVDCRTIFNSVDLISNGFRYQTIGNGGTRKHIREYYFFPDLVPHF